MLGLSLSLSLARMNGGGESYAPAPIPGDEFYITQISGTNRARMFVLSSYVAAIPEGQAFRAGVGTNTTANPVTDTTRPWSPDATGVGAGGLWESMDFGAGFVDTTAYGRTYVYPEGDYDNPWASTAVSEGVAFVDAEGDAPDWVEIPSVVSITDNDDGTYTILVDEGAAEGTPAPTVTIASVVDQDTTDLSAGIVDNADGTWSLTVTQTVDVQTITFTFEATNTEDTIQEVADAVIPALTVPGQMGAPTLVPSEGALTFQFGAVASDGGSPNTSFGYEVTLSSDPTYASPAFSGTQADTDDISLTPAAAGTYIGRDWQINAIGAGEKSDDSEPVVVVAPTTYTIGITEPSRTNIIVDRRSFNALTEEKAMRRAGVGRYSTNTLKTDLLTSPPTGVSVNGATNVVTFTAEGVTLEDYDLGAARIDFSGAVNCGIRNCVKSIPNGGNYWVTFGTGVNVFVENCDFDGGSDANAMSFMFQINGQAGHDRRFRYNFVTGFPTDCFKVFNFNAGDKINYNYFRQSGSYAFMPVHEDGPLYDGSAVYHTGVGTGGEGQYVGYKPAKTMYIYECLIDGTTGIAPPSGASSNANWGYIGPAPHTDIMTVTVAHDSSGGEMPEIVGNWFHWSPVTYFSIGRNDFIRCKATGTQTGKDMGNILIADNLFDADATKDVKITLYQNTAHIGAFYLYNNLEIRGSGDSSYENNCPENIYWGESNKYRNYTDPQYTANTGGPSMQHVPCPRTNFGTFPLGGPTNAPAGWAIWGQMHDSVTDAVTHSARQIGTSNGDGTWSGEFAGLTMRAAGEWDYPRVWPEGSENTADGTSTYGAGTMSGHEDQSNTNRGLIGGAGDNLVTPQTIGGEANQYQIITAHQLNYGSPAYPAASCLTVTDGDTKLPPPVFAYFKTFADMAPDEKVCQVWMCVSGSPVTDYYADIEAGNRTTAQINDCAAVVHEGGKVGSWLWQHENGLADSFIDYGYACFTWGETLDGSDVSGVDKYEPFTPFSPLGIRGDTNIYGIYAHAFPELLEEDRVQVLFHRVEGHDVRGDLNPTEIPGQEFEVGGVYVPNITFGTQENRQRTVTAPAFDFLAFDAEGDGTPGLHFNSGMEAGMPMAFRARAVRLGSVAGFVRLPYAYLDVVHYWDTDRFTGGCSLGNLTTNALLAANTDGFPDDPIGAPGTPGTRQVLGLFDQAGNMYGETYISDAAGAVDPDGGCVTIIPDTAFTGLSKVNHVNRYALGTGYEDARDLNYEDWFLVLDGYTVNGCALPIQFPTDEIRNALNAQNPIVSAPFFTVAGNTYYAKAVPSSTTSIRIEAKFAPVSISVNNGLAGQATGGGGQGFFLRQANTGLLTMTAGGATNLTTTSVGTLVQGDMNTVVAVMNLNDDGAGDDSMRVQLNGETEVVNESFASGSTTLRTTNLVVLAESTGTNKSSGSYEYIRVFLNDPTGVGTAWANFEGDAATVIAYAAANSWTLTGDAPT